MGVPIETAQLRPEIAFAHSSIIDYEKAWQIQRNLHSEIAQGSRPNTLMLLEHPSVFTAGRRTLENERPNDGTPVIDVDRGGKITWHGPGQLIGYPIVRLAKRHDVVGFVREIESALIKVCQEFGVSGQVRPVFERALRSGPAPAFHRGGQPDDDAGPGIDGDR